MRADPANVERGTRIIIASHYLERIGDRVDEHRRGHRLPRHRRGRGPQPVTSTERPATTHPRSCSCAPATRPAASWPRRCCATTAATDFEVHSAGTEPKGVNPLTLRVLAEAGSTHRGPAPSRSTSSSASRSTTSITVCDQARQVCPVFPGVHESLHWGYEDPAEAEGTEEERLAAFRASSSSIGERVQQFATVALTAGAQHGPPDASCYLLRHADAGDPEAWDGPDAARPLSDKGETQAERLGRFLAGDRLRDRPVITSPKVRARADRRDRRRADLAPTVDEDDRLGRRPRPRSTLEAILRDPATRSDRCSSATTRTSASSSATCLAAPSRCARARSPGSTSDGRCSPAAARCAGWSPRTRSRARALSRPAPASRRTLDEIAARPPGTRSRGRCRQAVGGRPGRGGRRSTSRVARTSTSPPRAGPAGGARRSAGRRRSRT